MQRKTKTTKKNCTKRETGRSGSLACSDRGSKTLSRFRSKKTIIFNNNSNNKYCCGHLVRCEWKVAFDSMKGDLISLCRAQTHLFNEPQLDIDTRIVSMDVSHVPNVFFSLLWRALGWPVDRWAQNATVATTIVSDGWSDNPATPNMPVVHATHPMCIYHGLHGTPVRYRRGHTTQNNWYAVGKSFFTAIVSTNVQEMAVAQWNSACSRLFTRQ